MPTASVRARFCVHGAFRVQNIETKTYITNVARLQNQIVTGTAITPTTPATAETEPCAKEKDSLKQMIIAKDLQRYIGDILAIDIELDMEARQYFRCLCMTHTIGLPEDSLICSIYSNTTPATVLVWIIQLGEAVIKENEGIIYDQLAGRSSAPEADHPYLNIRADLMLRFQELTKEAVKTIRYNSVPDYSVGKVQLLKCKSAFLLDPHSVAIWNVQKRKQDDLVEQFKVDESGNTSEWCWRIVSQEVEQCFSGYMIEFPPPPQFNSRALLPTFPAHCPNGSHFAQMGSHFAQNTTTNPSSLLSRHKLLSGFAQPSQTSFRNMYVHKPPPTPSKTPIFLA